METQAIARLGSETGNWLNRGRAALLRALLRRFAGQVSGDVLEIGAGFGQHVPILREWGPVDAIEVAPACRAALEHQRGLRDLFSTGVPGLALPRRYGVVSAFDVIEHIEDDGAALAWVSEHLLPGGMFIGTVPAYQWLFGPHDLANRHYRRYDKERLRATMPTSLAIRTCGYFNMTLLPAAIVAKLAWGALRHGGAGSASDKQSSDLPFPLGQLFYGILASEAALIGRGVCPPAGLSVYWVAERID